MKFIPHPKLPSQMLLGYRVASETGDLTRPDQAQQVLVAIVKGTYDMTDTGTVLAEEQEPLLLKDVLQNPIKNADFTDATEITDNEFIPKEWELNAPSTTKIQRLEEEQPGNTIDYLRIHGSGSVSQTLTFRQPLAGRTFQFNFKARLQETSASNLVVSGINLVTASNQAFLSGTWTIPKQLEFTEFSQVATWPFDVTDSEAIVTLSGVNDAAVDFDQIQVIEGSHIFKFNEPIRYEHDLAVFKRFTDIVVLGVPKPPAFSDGTLENDEWKVRVVSGSQEIVGLFSTLTATDAPIPSGAGRLIDLIMNRSATDFAFDGSTPFLFGWQPRIDSPRKDFAGQAKDFNPAMPDVMKLPDEFNNRFFNGGWYQSEDRPAFDHPLPGSEVSVIASANYVRGDGTVEPVTHQSQIRLPSLSPQFTITYLNSDNTKTLRETRPMQADTIVFDLDWQQIYVVWRGVWAESAPQLSLDRLISLEFS